MTQNDQNNLINYYFNSERNLKFDKLVEQQARRAVIHGLANGLVMDDKLDPDRFKLMPITLLPSPFPRGLYPLGLQLGLDYNVLYSAVANNHDFLQASLSNLTTTDPFFSRLWKIYEQSRVSPKQTIQLVINRSDYMVPSLECSHLKQIEINMIAVSFGGLVEQCADNNKFVIERLGIPQSSKEIATRREIASAILEAHNLYIEQNNCTAIVLFVVTEFKYNQVDQYLIEFELCRLNPQLVVKHANLREINSSGPLGSNFELLIEGQEVSVAYFRTGYTKNVMTLDEEWEGRLLIEESRAIKCPSVNYQLAGTKRIQQLVSDRSILCRFLRDEALVDRLLNSMVGQFSLNGSEGHDAIKDAEMNSEKYVLKSQLEGGGNNIFGKEMVDKLKSGDDCSTYTLMERIHPFVHQNLILRGLGGPFVKEEVISEYSFFGVILTDGDKVVRNSSFGNIVRSKAVADDEGGITSGSGCLSSMYLLS